MRNLDYIYDREWYNDVYYPLLERKERRKILYGSRDTGKSLFIAQRLVIDCLTLDYFKCILIRKQYNTIKESQWETIKQVIEDWELLPFFDLLKSPLEIRCTNGNRFISRGMDDPAKAKSIKDPTHAWYEEADQLSLLDFETTTLSLRNSRGIKIQEWFSFNAGNPKLWIVKEFFPPIKSFEKADGMHTVVDSIQPDTLIMHTCYKHNQFITDDRIQIYRSLKSRKPEVYKMDGLGLFGTNVEGLIYPNYSIIDELPFELMKFNLIGGDFGYTDPAAFVRVGVDSSHTNLYIDQLIYKTHLDDNQLIKEMKSSGIDPLDIGYLDSSEPGTIATIQNAGFHRMKPAKKDKGSVVAGIKKKKGYNIHITKRSKNLIDEIDTYEWDKDKYGEYVEKPKDGNDHALDASRYPIYTHFYKPQGFKAKAV